MPCIINTHSCGMSTEPDLYKVFYIVLDSFQIGTLTESSCSLIVFVNIYKVIKILLLVKLGKILIKVSIISY